MTIMNLLATSVLPTFPSSSLATKIFLLSPSTSISSAFLFIPILDEGEESSRSEEEEEEEEPVSGCEGREDIDADGWIGEFSEGEEMELEAAGVEEQELLEVWLPMYRAFNLEVAEQKMFNSKNNHVEHNLYNCD